MEGRSINACKYVMDGSQENGYKLFLMLPRDKTRNNKHNLKQEVPSEHEEKFPFFESDLQILFLFCGLDHVFLVSVSVMYGIFPSLASSIHRPHYVSILRNRIFCQLKMIQAPTYLLKTEQANRKGE